jgi:hypothetical protein
MSTIIATIGCLIIETIIGIGININVANIEKANAEAVAAEQINTEKAAQNYYNTAARAAHTDTSEEVFN